MAKRGNGEGSIFYSEERKRWLGQFCFGYKEDGKVNRKTISGKTRKEVTEKMIKYQSLIQNNKFCDKSKVTLYTIGKNIADNKRESNIINDNTYKRHIDTLKILKPLWDIELQKITPDEIQKYLNSMTYYSNATLRKITLYLGEIFKDAIKRKIIVSNPMDLIIKPKSKKIEGKYRKAFTVEEEQLILANLKGEQYENIFMIAFHTGMRIGEILALTPMDINFKEKTININKTITRDESDSPVVGKTTKTFSGSRVIPYIDILEPYLKDAVNKFTKNKNNLLFHNGDFPLRNSTINTQFKRICKNLNIGIKPRKIVRGSKVINSYTSDVHLHMTRHTYATRCIESNMPPVVLQRLLGHHDISITLDTYTTVFNKFQENSLQSYVNYINKMI